MNGFEGRSKTVHPFVAITGGKVENAFIEFLALPLATKRNLKSLANIHDAVQCSCLEQT